MKFLKKVSFFLFFLCVSFYTYGNPTFDFIKNKGLDCEKQVLRSGSEEFPCNVIAEFGESSTQSLNFLISQSDFEYFFGENELKVISEKLSDFPKTVRFVFTANSFSPAAPDTFSPPGSEIWMDSIPHTENATIVFLRKNVSGEAVVYSAANRNVSPLFITRAAVEALLEIDVPYSVANFLQRYESTGFDKGLSLALRKKHSAVSVGLQSHQSLAFIDELTKIYSRGFSDEMDTHYLVLNFRNNCFFITEMMILISLLLFLGIPMFLTTVFAFGRRKNGAQNRENFKKLFPLIPILLIFMTFSLVLGRFFAKKIIFDYHQAPFLTLCLNVAISGIFFTGMIFFRRFMYFPNESYVYSFLLMTFSLLNVFVFSEINLTLFAIFLAFYLISTLLSSTKNMVVKSIFLILPISVIMFRFRLTELSEFKMASLFILDAPLGRTFLFSMILIPVILIFMEFFMWLKTFFRRLTFSGFLLGFSTIAFIFTLGMIVFAKTHLPKNPEPRTENVINPSGNFEITFLSEDFFDQQKIVLEIKSNRNAIYYDVELSADSGIAVYDANFPFESTSDPGLGSSRAKILLDENPPFAFSVEYICDYERVNKAVVLGYFQNAKGEIFTESKEVIFDARL